VVEVVNFGLLALRRGLSFGGPVLGLDRLSIGLKLLEVVHVLDAEVVPLEATLSEVESPDFADLALRDLQLLKVLAAVQGFLDG